MNLWATNSPGLICLKDRPDQMANSDDWIKFLGPDGRSVWYGALPSRRRSAFGGGTTAATWSISLAACRLAPEKKLPREVDRGN